MLIDTDVLIWLARGHPGAARRLGQIDHWRISAITYMELVQGCRNNAEVDRMRAALRTRGTCMVPVRESICSRAIQLIERHALADGLRLADALIAATALEGAIPLLTGNARHFGAVEGLRIEKFEPALP